MNCVDDFKFSLLFFGSDLKPSNILLKTDSSIVIADFALPTIVSDLRQRTRTFIGQCGYACVKFCNIHEWQMLNALGIYLRIQLVLYLCLHPPMFDGLSKFSWDVFLNKCMCIYVYVYMRMYVYTHLWSCTVSVCM